MVGRGWSGSNHSPRLIVELIVEHLTFHIAQSPEFDKFKPGLALPP